MAQVLYMYPIQNNGNPAALFKGLRSNRPPGANNRKTTEETTEEKNENRVPNGDPIRTRYEFSTKVRGFTSAHKTYCRKC